MDDGPVFGVAEHDRRATRVDHALRRLEHGLHFVNHLSRFKFAVNERVKKSFLKQEDRLGTIRVANHLRHLGREFNEQFAKLLVTEKAFLPILSSLFLSLYKSIIILDNLLLFSNIFIAPLCLKIFTVSFIFEKYFPITIHLDIWAGSIMLCPPTGDKVPPSITILAEEINVPLSPKVSAKYTCVFFFW